MAGKITFKQHLKSSSRLQSEEPFHITFQILATADFKVTWYHNDKQLESTDDVTISTDNEFGKCQVLFKQTKIEYSGTYRCEIDCAGTKATTCCTVIIKEVKGGILFEEFPASTSVEQGADISFKCSLLAAATVFWKKGDVTLDSSERFKFVDTDDTAVFKILSAQPEDSGIYTAEVMDLATDEVAHCSFSLQVSLK